MVIPEKPVRHTIATAAFKHNFEARYASVEALSLGTGR
jgi:hypothetical protein